MIANVVVDIPSKNVDKIFDYKIPPDIEEIVKVGVRVEVPFGSRKIQGFVINISEQLSSDIDMSKVKSIIRVKDFKPELTPELIKLSEWMANFHLVKRISALEIMLPSAVKAKYQKIYQVNDPENLPAHILNRFNKEGILTFDQAQQSEIVTDLEGYVKSGQLVKDTIVGQQLTKKYATCIRIMPTDRLDEIIESLHKKEKQLDILNYLIEHRNEDVLLKTLKEEGFSNSSINTLVKNQVLEKYNSVVARDPYENRIFEKEHNKSLTNDQQHAFTQINEAVQGNESTTFLLHGVTGSGKTEIYLQTIENVLEKGEQAIILVPEIALTPQMVNRFKARFGDEVAVLHSGLSKGEKYDEWQKIRDGKASVSVGARSSIFAPFEKLGLIIIDEEHESTYKQEDYPRYHAREIAIWRSEYHQCPVVLGSATPSLETFARAEKNVYQYLELPERVNKQKMPEIELIDMREELKEGNRSMFSEQLKQAIQERIDKNEQVVLFLNRRGHSSFVLCRDCGHVPQCPNCDISLTYHKTHDDLKCHYCGYSEPMPQLCPSCESEHIRQMGVGTQQVEEQIYSTFEQAKVIRMDVDTTSRKGAHEKLLTAFGEQEANILLGTQMIAKGLDFENITLVGVLNADTMLNLPDFRSSEKTFQLLTQVAGRAGRHKKKGEVMIQTYNPEHYAILDVTKNDYLSFYQKEMKFRQIGKYPPYYYLVNLTISHFDKTKVLKAAKHAHDILIQHVSSKSFILGPSPSPLSRINNQHRFQILIKFKSEPDLLTALQYLDDYYHEQYVKDKLSLEIDINPQMMM
ncbi:primosomal protein N' [Mammaliicoccus stepanovicii]|uniref:Replication restart protein PriA n=1 Tax=Mammaliicoccus stepanovicii TaxID=643214 RepID=A0A239ZJZ8_9STAP|nr:primosomal protein N' [Mammaliicoccus stepanovicii]PNZ77943.1 primosomal protein N' [Mammaliicoccus stepanovicii]GGI41667.1 primosomal protein N' [Mammaliicoccus stepanovicii]SNV71269.1 primosomal protein [Mammaliicoccus stepanovicii]